MKSLSNGQLFPLFICHGELLTRPVSGTFSSYGLSQIATIPGSNALGRADKRLDLTETGGEVHAGFSLPSGTLFYNRFVSY
jgi:hypothetical protein